MNFKKTEFTEWSLLFCFILAALVLGLSFAIFYHILLIVRQKLEARRMYIQERRTIESKQGKQMAKTNVVDQFAQIRERRTRGK